MKILVVGSGGREHALCWAIAASPLCDKLWCAPGNAGIAEEAECVDIAADDVDALVAFAQGEAADLVVVGPEQPLVMGLVDRLTEVGIKAFGPSAAAAELEGSKGFMKDLCGKYGIPTAAYGRFTDIAAAQDFIVVVPFFSKQHFPGAERYNLGYVFDPDTGRERPREKWTFNSRKPGPATASCRSPCRRRPWMMRLPRPIVTLRNRLASSVAWLSRAEHFAGCSALESQATIKADHARERVLHFFGRASSSRPHRHGG